MKEMDCIQCIKILFQPSSVVYWWTFGDLTQPIVCAEHHRHHHHHLFANVKHRQQQVQNYNSGRTTRQRAALTVAVKYMD